MLSIGFWTFVAITSGVYTIFAFGLQLQYGHTGLLNFGHIAFMAIGSYTMALLVVHTSMPLVAAALIAVVVAMLFGVAVALPALRLRADYLAITTIAFGEIIRILIANQVSWTNGPRGVRGFDGDLVTLIDRTGVARDTVLLIGVWTTAALAYLFLRRLTRSPWGRVLRAIREDEDAAAALGKDTFRYKLAVMAIGSGLAAVAGFFFAFQLRFLSPTSFLPVFTFFAWVIILLGGVGRLGGVALGAVVFSVLFAGTRFFGFWPFDVISAADQGALRMIVIGLLLIALMAFRPQGILGKREELLLDR